MINYDCTGSQMLALDDLGDVRYHRMALLATPEDELRRRLIDEGYSPDYSGLANKSEIIRPLRGYVSLGEPQQRIITVESVSKDEDLQAFVSKEARQFAYHQVHLACSFHRDPEGKEAFERAMLQIYLHSARYQLSDPVPIAWSLEPKRVTDGAEAIQTLSLGAKLKLIDTSVTQQTKSEGGLVVLGFGELESRPYWEINRTKRRELEGIWNFNLIIRRAIHVRGAAEITISGSVRHEGIFWHWYGHSPSKTQRLLLYGSPYRRTRRTGG
jgi:hypothetical protein